MDLYIYVLKNQHLLLHWFMYIFVERSICFIDIYIYIFLVIQYLFYGFAYLATPPEIYLSRCRHCAASWYDVMWSVVLCFRDAALCPCYGFGIRPHQNPLILQWGRRSTCHVLKPVLVLRTTRGGTQSRCIAKEIWKTYLLLMVGLIACSTNVVGHTLASVCIAGLMVGGSMEALI